VFNSTLMDEETRESRSIKIKPSILRKAHHVAIEEGKSLGRWIEDVIEEKLEGERGGKEPKIERPATAGLSGVIR